MTRNSISLQQQSIQVNKQLACMRQSIDRYGLSATIGMLFCFTTSQAASAHTIVPPPAPPVVHTTTVVHVVHATSTNSAAATTSKTSTSLSKTFTTTSSTTTKHTATTTVNNPATNLNLGSTSANVSASLLGSFKTITLDIGGKTDVVKMTSKLTDAELVAAQQVLSGGSQTLAIDSKGAATGGTIQLNNALVSSLDTALGGNLTAITIPKNLTIDDSVSKLNLTGSLSNYGSVVAQSSGTGGGDTISASNIYNAGAITGRNIDLTLTAPTITNIGTISSNTNVNLNTAVLNNTGGTVSATQAINVSNAGGVAIKGGELLSQTLNLNAGNSALTVNGTNITGVVNDTAGSAHINATSKDFLLGVSNVTGDPLYSSTGNFTITSAVSATNGNDLSIVAGGSVLSTVGASLNTSNNTGNGGNLLVVAGANFTVDPASGNLTITQSNLVNGGSLTGGSINLTGINSINTSSTVSQGGSVSMIAYAGSTAGSGAVTVPSAVTIQTGVNSQNISAGNVEIFAGAQSGTSIALGNIASSGSNDPIIYLVTSTPTVTSGAVTINSTGSLIGGGFSASPLAISPANISVGNIYAQGSYSQVNLQAGGTVAFKTINTSGFGGQISPYFSGQTASSGLSAGSVSIAARTGITGGSILAYGGGGAGGDGADSLTNGDTGMKGGSGGSGTYVTLTTTGGGIAISGTINASGGGGGGGGAGGTSASGSVAGTGGSGGSAGAVTLTTNTGTVNVLQGIYAVNGAAGGAGGLAPSATAAGSGGGGGGSYGGGGGGGGASLAGTTIANGGGGGGGLWGGGGGGNGSTQALTLGGSGGGAAQFGQGPAGSTPTTQGGQYSGGSGQSNPLSGGALGAGGLSGTAGAAGLGGNVINNDIVNGNSVTISASTGIGTSAAPLYVLSPDISLSAPLGSLYVQSGATTLFTSLVSSTTGTVSLSALGTLVVGAPINAAVVSLSTLPLSNGNINLDQSINATTSVTANASGSGAIQQFSYGMITPTLTANSGSGIIDLAPSYSNRISNFQFNTTGNYVQLANLGNLNVLTSSATGADAEIYVGTNEGTLTVAGPVNVMAGTANFNGGTGIAVNAQITAPGGVNLQTTIGTITSPLVLTNSGPISLTVSSGALGALSVNAPVVTISASAATITDVYTGYTTLALATGSFGSPIGNFIFSSAGSTLNVNNVGNFINVTVKDTSASGSIVLGTNAITASNVATVGTVGGSITTNAAAANSSNITAPTVSLLTTSGNIGGYGGGALMIQAANLSVAASGTSSTVNLNDDTAVNISSITANNLTLIAPNIDIAGKISAPTINLTSNGDIAQTTSTGLISGTTATLTANYIGSILSPAGLNVNLTGSGSALSLSADEAAVQSAVALNLSNSSVADILSVSSASTLTQSGVVSVNGSAFLTGSSFNQASGASFTGSQTDITANLGSTSSVVINGNFNSSLLNVIAPATGTVTVGPGGVVNAPIANFQSGTITIAGPAGALPAGIIETSSTPATATGSIAFSNPTGSLTLGGTGTLGASQYLTLSSGGNIIISPALISSGLAQNETITAKGTVNLPTGTLAVGNDSSGNGGTLVVTATSLLINGTAVSGSNLLAFNAAANSIPASGPTTGSGGFISLTLTGTGAATIGSANSEYSFTANGGTTGGNGGSIYVKTGGALGVTTGIDLSDGPVAAGGNGGNLTLLAGTNLSILGSLDTAPGSAANSTYGNITLGANGSATTPFVIDAGATTNGISGNIHGGNITISNTSGVTIGAANAIVVDNNGVSGVVPTLTLNTNNVSFLVGGTISNSSALAINSTGNLTLASAGNYGDPSSVTVNAKGNVSVPTTLLNQAGTNNLSLTATGTLTLPYSIITVVQETGSNNGGSIYINALAQNYTTGVTGALNLNATGGAGGNGGVVSYELGGTSAINVATGGTVVVNVSSATGGGSVNIQNKGAITIGAGGIIDNGALNNNVSVISAAGNVLVNAAGVSTLNINQGNLVLESNSATTFEVGGVVVTNGIQASSQINTGTFTIGNSGGAVALNEAIVANPVSPPATGYGADVFAKGNITDTFSSSAPVITGPSIALLSSTGSVGALATGGTVIINGTNTGNAPANVAITDGGAANVVNVKDTSTNGDILTTATAGSTYNFTGGGSIQTNAAITAGIVNLTAASTSTSNLTLGGTVGSGTGAVTLTAGGTFSQTFGTVAAGTLDFTLGTMASPLLTNATTIGNGGLSTVTGLINPTINIVDSATALLTLNGLSTTNASGTISVITGGSIAANGNIGGGSNASGNTTLTAGPGGTITEKTGVNITGTSFLSLTSANLGGATPATAFNVSGGVLYLSTPGIVNIVDNLTGPTPAITGATIQDVSGTVTSFTFSAAGPITLNNVTSTGNILVNDTSTTGAGGITTNVGTQLISKAGTITLDSQNSSTTAGSGGLNLEGNVLATNVTLTTGTGAGNNIIMGGSIGTGGGVVNLTATGDIDQTGGTAYVFAKTLDFSAANLYGNVPTMLEALETTATAINQVGPATGTSGILISDSTTSPLTVSALNITGSNAQISLSTGGNLTTLGAVTAGNTINPANAGDVMLTSGMSLVLGGSVGLAGTSNTTTLNVGNNANGLPVPAGSTGLTIGSSSSIDGANIVLSNTYPIGGIGTTATALTTNATNNLTINASGAVNVVNYGGGSVVTLHVGSSQSLNFINNATAGGGLTLDSVSAETNGGGAINIVSAGGALTVGAIGAAYEVQNGSGSINLSTTSTGMAGNVNVVDSTNIVAGNGAIIITGSGSSLLIGQTGGAGVSFNASAGVTITKSPSSGGTVTLGDAITVSVQSGNITITSPTTLTVGDALSLNVNSGNISLTATNGLLTIGNPSTGATGALAYLSASNGNISIDSLGASGAITIGNDTMTAYGGGASGGLISIDTTGVLNLASTPTNAQIAMSMGMTSHLTADNYSSPAAGGISLSGSTVNWATNYGYNSSTSYNNINITSTGVGGAINLGGNTGTTILAATGYSYSAIGDITLQATGATGAVNIGSNSSLTTYGESVASGNFLVQGSTINVGQYTEITSQGYGSSNSGNLTMASSGTGGLTIGQGVDLNAFGNVGSVSLTAGGSLNVGDGVDVNSAQGVTLSTTGPSLIVGTNGGSGAQLTANNGNLSLSNTSLSGTIEIGTNTYLKAFAQAVSPTAGNVSLTIGAAGSPIVTPTVGNVQYNVTYPGAILATSAANFTANGAQSTFNAQGSDIFLNNAGSASQITFDGGNSITADPPVVAVVALPVANTVALTLPVATPQTASNLTGAGGGLQIGQADHSSQPGPGIASGGSLLGTAGGGSLSVTGSASTGTNYGGVNVEPVAGTAASSVRNALSGESLQSVSGSAVSANFASLSSGAGAPTFVQSLLGSVNGTSAVATSALANIQTAGVLEANSAQNMTGTSVDLNKTLAGGVSIKANPREKHAYITRELPKGALLVAPERLTVITTPFGNVQVADRAVALVVSNEHGLSVYNLDDSHRDSVLVHINGETITLAPGRHITVTNEAVERFEQINPAPYIAYRHVFTRTMNGNMKAFHSEFSHLTAISGLEPLKNIVKSDDPVKRKLGAHMLKTSALLSLMSKSTAAFELMTDASVTAMR